MNNQIYNIISSYIYTKTETKHNIYYEPIYSLYDALMLLNDEYNYHYKNDSEQTIELSHYIEYINNPIDFSRNIQSSTSYSHKILFFHTTPSARIKKEDIFLINQSIGHYPCYSYINNNIGWGIKNIDYIKYGVPINKKSEEISKTKDIAILNNAINSEENTRLFHSLKNQYNSIDLITIKENHTFDYYLDLISNYKILIDTSSYFNCLCGISVGCCAITSSNYNNDKYIYSVDSYDNLLNQIKNILSNPSNIQDMIEYIDTNYNYRAFMESIHNINTKFLNQNINI